MYLLTIYNETMQMLPKGYSSTKEVYEGYPPAMRIGGPLNV
jgi:hypothetical protein